MTLDDAHRLAMDAKALVFRPQDACSLAWEHDPQRRAALSKVEKKLAKIRADLEEIDRDVLSARWKNGGR